MPSDSPVIDTFMNLYTGNIEKWETIAQKVKAKCQETMGPTGHGVTALYMHRAKTEESLRKKLRDRNEKRRNTEKGEFRDNNDIYDEVPDFAGVRIVLYFPNESRDVEEIIFQNFSVIETKDHNGRKADPSQSTVSKHDLKERKFTGYIAKHYIIDVEEDMDMFGLDAEDLPLRKPVVEIQVMSLILHVWSEIEHDIEYKTHGDRPTLAERATLDSLNGLVLTGERVIETLYVCRTRAAQDKTPEKEFNNRYELEVFIQDKQATFSKTFYGDSGSVLSAFLTRFKMSKPRALEPILGRLSQAKQSDPCLRLINLGFEVDAASCIMLQILQDQCVPSSQTALTELERSIIQLILGQPISIGWKTFESVLEKKCKDNAYRYRLILNSLSWIVELFGSQKAFDNYWRDIVEKMPKDEEKSLYRVTSNRDHLEDNLDSSYTPDFEKPGLESLWCWLLTQLEERNPIVGFGFGISLLNVERELTVRIIHQMQTRLFDFHVKNEAGSGNK